MKADIKLQIGDETTGGFGTGGSAEFGYKVADLERERIAQVIGHCDLLIIVARLGRGTGTGAAAQKESLRRR